MSQSNLNDAVAALAEGVLEDSGHPSADELLAYQTGELDGDDESRIREHLGWCTECAGTVVDLASWPDVELRDPELARTDAEEAEDWQAIRRRLEPEDAVPAPVVPFPTTRPAYGGIHLLAAVLFVAVVGLSVQVMRLNRRPPTPLAPQANVFVVDLEPVGAPTSRTAAVEGLDVPAGMGTVVFLLVVDDVRSFDDHTVELRGENGEVLWQTAGLVSPPEGGFSVAVPLAALPSDAVEIRLYGVTGEDRELLSTYRARIERDAVR